MLDENRRKRLKNVVSGLRKINSPVANKYIDLIEGSADELFLGYLEKETVSVFCANKKTRIVLSKEYFCHMDNSGHLIGKGFGRKGHHDDTPLTIEELISLPTVVKGAKWYEVEEINSSEIGQRYKICHLDEKYVLAIIVEVVNSKERINIVTAYKLSKRQGALIKTRLTQSQVSNESTIAERVRSHHVRSDRINCLHYIMNSSILEVISRRITGSFSFSSGVNFERTKSTSPIFFLRLSFPVPTRMRGKLSVPSFSIVDFSPLFPPALPLSRRRRLPKSRLKSSQMTRISEFLIL